VGTQCLNWELGKSTYSSADAAGPCDLRHSPQAEANMFDLVQAAAWLTDFGLKWAFISGIFSDGAYGLGCCDGGYAGRKMAVTVWRTGAWSFLQIVKRSDAAGFEVLPKRWIVERTFAWISRDRRVARDFERYATTVAASSASP